MNPDPTFGVLGAPVVADHPGPVVELHGAFAKADLSAEDAAGNGETSLVRGTGARYIQSRGRWRSSGSGCANVRSQVAPSAEPVTRLSANTESPIRMN